MKHFPAVVFILLLALSPTTALSGIFSELNQWAEKQPPLFASTADIVDYAKPAVVFIRHRDQSGEQVAGTGFIAQQDGLIITCAHVVRESKPEEPKTTDKIWVRTYDGMVYEAERRNVLADSDIAILKINVTGYPYLDVETTPPKLGDEIIVIGYPLSQTVGTDPSVSKGIISAIRFGEVAYQLDAAVNPGNSGGPVLNKDGDVLGVLSFKVRGAEGMAFAISAGLFHLQPSHDSGPAFAARLNRERHIRHNKRPLLFRAADCGDLTLTKKLLAAGEKVNVQNDLGDTPLTYAVMAVDGAPTNDIAYRSHKLEIATLLIEHGADVNAAKSYVLLGETLVGQPPLYYAARWSPECVMLLIQHEAKVDGEPKAGTSPLWAACTCNNIQCAELLIKNGASVNSPDVQGRTILRWLREYVARPPGDSDPNLYDDMMSLLRRHGATE